MEENDRLDWYQFRNNDAPNVTHTEYVMIAKLHSKYYNHKYKLPCKCNPRVINKYIEDLNKLYEANNYNE